MAHNSFTILIVDDNPDVRDVLATFLRLAGFQVMEAEDGQAGCALAVEKHPALIFCDEHMPRMDGCATLRCLKSRPLTKSIPVVMMSGSHNSDDAEWRQRGALCLLSKPIDFEQLVALAQSVLCPQPS